MNDHHVYVRAHQLHKPHGPLPIGRSTFYEFVDRGWLPPGRLVTPRMRVWKLDDVVAAFGQLGEVEA